MDQNELIDFREIAAKYTFSEHAQRADRYFAGMNIDSPVARKPFASVEEVPGIVGGIAMVVSGLGLYHGVRVLDFGSGTCWVSRLLASLGCEVTAVDVSASALKLGEELIRNDPVGKHLNVSFRVLEGQLLPFPDGSFDRVVVFDAFHHCRDQLPMIAEFHRVLSSGGIAAFHEPGPNHSRSQQSQYEMRHFDVIEGDIVVEDIFAEARRVGFGRAQLAAYLSVPAMLDLERYDEFLAGQGGTGAWLAEQARQECENRRVFFLHKGDAAAPDSRARIGLQAELRGIELRLAETGIVVSGLVENVGTSTWLPSGGKIGSVNLGVHMKDEVHYDHDFARINVSAAEVPPGGSCSVSGLLRYPDATQFRLGLDLVAEGVTWFELNGIKLSEFEVDSVAGTIRRV